MVIEELERKRREAQKLHLRNSLPEAEKIYRYLISIDPQDCDAANLGAILRIQGRHLESMKLYEEWLKQENRTPELYLNAINCAIECGKLETCKKWVIKGLKYHSKDINLEKAYSRYLIAKGEYKEAIKVVSSLADRCGRDAEIKLILARASYMDKQYDKALEIYNRMITKEERVGECISNTILILQETNQIDKARIYINSLNDKVKKNIDVRRSIAYFWLSIEEYEKASDEYERLCKEETQQPLNWLNHCAAQRGLKHSYSALTITKKGFMLHPKNKKLKYALMQCLAETGKLSSAEKIIEETLTNTDRIDEQLLFGLQFVGEGYKIADKYRLRQIAQAWEEETKKDLVVNVWADYMKSPSSSRKIRIGYFSHDFCDHPVGRFIKPIIEAHDKDKFTIYCIDSNMFEDTIKESLRILSDHWININQIDDTKAAELVAGLQLDVIVELGGYTSGSRLGVLCGKCAPIQLSYLGYFAPTYINAIDGWIGDKVLFEHNSSIHKKAHKQLMVEGGYMAYKEEILTNRVRCKDKSFRFGSFNHARKLSNETLELFANVLKIDENIKIVLKSINFVEQEGIEEMIRRLNAFSINEERVEILPWVKGRKSHLECYKYIDVALDPFPYGGATTTCEALSMGVPVITLRGKSMVENLSASILYSAGKVEWVAKNKADYVKIAKQLYGKGFNTKERRDYLASRIQRSDLCNNNRVARQLENIYREEVARHEKQFSSECIREEALPSSLERTIFRQ